MIGNCAITRKRCYTKDEAKKALRAILRKGLVPTRQVRVPGVLLRLVHVTPPRE